MIQVRYLYKNHLIGEWADAVDGTYLYPNPEYRADIIAVQVREDENSPLPARGAARRSKAKSHDARKLQAIVPNGKEPRNREEKQVQ